MDVDFNYLIVLEEAPICPIPKYDKRLVAVIQYFSAVSGRSLYTVMPKISSNSNERSIKKARLAEPLNTKRIRGSPRPANLTKKLSKAASVEATSVLAPSKTQDKGKGKEKEISNLSLKALPTTFKVVAGSYEKLLYGLEGTVTASDSLNDDSDYVFNLKPIFMFPAHVSCIKSVATSPTGGKWLATGSADEIVKVWDLRRRKEIGGLMHHEGTRVPAIFFRRRISLLFIFGQVQSRI